MDIYLLIYLILIVAPISTIIHESGHMIGSFLSKSDHMKLSIGYGKEIIHFSKKNIEVTIRLFFFLNGNTKSERHRPYGVMEHILISVCGPLNNIIFVFLFYFIYMIHPNDYILLFIFFNGWLAITNIIPYKIKDRYSDGYLIVKMIKTKILKNEI